MYQPNREAHAREIQEINMQYRYLRSSEHFINYINKIYRDNSSGTSGSQNILPSEFYIKNIYDTGVAERFTWDFKKDIHLLEEPKVIAWILKEVPNRDILYVDLKKPIGHSKDKTRCVSCNVIVSKKNVGKHCRKVHKGIPISEVLFDDSGIEFKIPIYRDYINSPAWKKKSDAAKERAKYRCQVCNTKDEILDTHHRTYERLGRELESDLIVLCRSCHTLFETKSKNRPANKHH